MAAFRAFRPTTTPNSTNSHLPTLRLPRIVPSDRSLVNEDSLAGVVAIDETAFLLDVKL